MYKEYPTFYWYEVYKYGRKSRFDDPYLSVEEVLIPIDFTAGSLLGVIVDCEDMIMP